MTTKEQVIDQSISDAYVNTIRDLVQHIEKQHQTDQHNPYSARELWPNLFAKADEVLLNLADKATLDPLVSADAQALIDRGRQEALHALNVRLFGEVISSREQADRYAVSNRCGRRRIVIDNPEGFDE